MCVIIVKPIGAKLPDKNTLKNCWNNNSNGAGYAIVKDNHIKLRKGFLKFKRLLQALEQEHITEDEMVLLHFRTATAGLIDAGNTHPFVITTSNQILRQTEIDTTRIVVAHNGVLTGLGQDKKLSDTQMFIKQFLADEHIYKALYESPAVQRLIGEYITTDKLAFLDYKKGVLLIGEFEKHEGCLYSNGDYKKREKIAFFGNNNWKEFNYNTVNNNAFGKKVWNDNHQCEYCYEYANDVEWVSEYSAFLCPKCCVEFDNDMYRTITEGEI